MDLQISVFLLFVLFTAGHSLKCNDCTSGTCTEKTCTEASPNCVSAKDFNGFAATTTKNCIEASSCPTGFISYGAVRASSTCCNADNCNSQDAPEPSFAPNGKRCFSCDGVKSNNCSNVLGCSGTEDRCFNATTTSGVSVRGCASKTACDGKQAISTLLKLASVSCCDGDLCNGAQSVSQSFLFLCCSLLSYFLLH